MIMINMHYNCYTVDGYADVAVVCVVLGELIVPKIPQNLIFMRHQLGPCMVTSHY